MTDEVWKPVVGLEGAYEVSDQGRVRSVRRVVRSGQRGGTREVAPQILSTPKGSAGYRQVTLRRKTHLVHSLVMAAFVGPRPVGMETCHNNGDPDDNRLANLRYDTISENRLDIVRHGRSQAANRTACPKGHPYDEQNTGSSQGNRRCLTCHRERERIRQAARRSQAA